MKVNTSKFRLALNALTLAALCLGIVVLAVGPVQADDPVVPDERMWSSGERPETRPSRSPQSPTPADVSGQWEQLADLQDLSLPKLSAGPGCGGGSWVITAILGDGAASLPGAVYTMDTATNTLYGPFLQGQLDSAGGGLLDVAVTPNCSTALVSNFGDKTVFFVDVSAPTAPSLLGSVVLPMFAEDIAITPNCRYALVTDGGFASQVASIDIATRTLVETVDLGANDAQSVAVAPNGTVIVADYLGGQLHTLIFDGSGHLTPVASYQLPVNPEVNEADWPVNVAVAPDGQTVLEITAFYGWLRVFRITGPGILTDVGRLDGLPPIWDEANTQFYGGQQSVAFSCDGSQAYVITNGRKTLPPESAELPNQISVLDITAPGEVSLSAAGAATLFNYSSGQFYGVDVLAVADGKLYVGNPIASAAANYLHVVDLTNYAVISETVGTLDGEWPIGVAAFSPATLTVEIVGAGMATGRVSSTSDPSDCVSGGISCPADCIETYCTGTVVTLTAHPGVDSYLMEWSEDCSGTERTTQVIMDASKHCIATFGYPVGGVVVPVNKLGLMAPWLGLAALVAVGAVLLHTRRTNPK